MRTGFFIFACLLFLYSSNIHTAKAGNSETLKIATIPLPPWGYKDKEGKPAGITYEWANEIARRLAMPSVNRIVPMKRVFKELEFGTADFSIMLRTPASEKIAVPVGYVGVDFKTVIWPRKGIHISSFDDLKGLRLSMVRGLKVGGEFSKQKNLIIAPSIDYPHSINMIKLGRADAVVGTYQSLVYNAFKAGMAPDEYFDTPFIVAQLEGWVQVSRAYAHREGLTKITKVIEGMQQDGTFQRIFDAYTSK